MIVERRSYVVHEGREQEAIDILKEAWRGLDFPNAHRIYKGIIGPFDVGVVATKHLPEDPRVGLPGMFKPRGPDEGWKPGATYTENGKRYAWQQVAADTAGKLDFDAVLGMRDYLLGYAACAIYNPVARRTAARIRADNFMRIFVNGELVGENYGAPYDADYVPVDLEAGWNTLLVKLVNNHGNWYFVLHLFDEEGDLRFAPHAP